MNTKETSNELRVIAHIDMDCFYAQVDANRMGVNCRTEPFVLAQWGSLIAVNYPARARGVARFTTLQEAKQICPELKVGEVATYRVGETTYDYHPNPDKQTHKIALEPYRMASRAIFSILNSFDGVDVEKGSVDEAYLDLTVAAQQELKYILKTYTSSSSLEIMEKTSQMHKIDEEGVQEEKEHTEEYKECEIKTSEIKQKELNTLEREEYLLQQQQSSSHLLSLEENKSYLLNKFTLNPLRDVMEPSTRLVPDRTEEMNRWCTAHHTTLEEVYHTPMRWLRQEYHIDNNGNTFPAGVEGSVSYCLPENEEAYSKHIHRNLEGESKHKVHCQEEEEEELEEEYYQHSLLLCAASRVVKRIRDKLVQELNYDCSAGIAHNRLLAKSLSAMNKPNQQTLLLPDRTASAMFTMKLRKLQGFGGKLGSAVESFRPKKEYCRDFWLVPLHDLAHISVYETSMEDKDEHADDDNDSFSQKEEEESSSSSTSSSLSEEYEEEEEEKEIIHEYEQVGRTSGSLEKNEVDVEQMEELKTPMKQESELHTECCESNMHASKTIETNQYSTSTTSSKTENVHGNNNSNSSHKVRYSNKMFHSNNSIANYVFYRIRGFAVNTIRQRSMSKSLIASKNFRPGTNRDEDIEKWLIVLSSELADRYAEFTHIFHVVGNNLNIKLGGTGHVNIGGMFNKTCALPVIVNTENLTHAAMHEVRSFLAQLREDAQSITRSSRRGRNALNRHLHNRNGNGSSPRLVNVVTVTIGRFKPIASTGSVQTLLTSFTSHNNQIRSVSSSPEELHHQEYNNVSSTKQDKGNDYNDHLFLHGDRINSNNNSNGSVRVSQSSVISISPSPPSPYAISSIEHNTTSESNVCVSCDNNEMNNTHYETYGRRVKHNKNEPSVNDDVIEVDSHSSTERSRSMGSHSSHFAKTPHKSSNKSHKHTNTEECSNITRTTTPQRSVLQALQDAARRQSKEYNQNTPCDKAHAVEVESISQLSSMPEEEEEIAENEELELLEETPEEVSQTHSSQDVQIDQMKRANRKRRRKESAKENVQHTTYNRSKSSCNDDDDCHQVHHHTIN